jgi:hypothetical protein
MDSGIVNESTFAQSGAWPTLAFWSSRACSDVVIVPPMMLRSSRQSGFSFAHRVKSLRNPSATSETTPAASTTR